MVMVAQEYKGQKMVVTKYNRFDVLGDFRDVVTFGYLPSWRERVIKNTVDKLVDVNDHQRAMWREILTNRLNIYVDENPMLLSDEDKLWTQGLYFREGYNNALEGLRGKLR